MREFRPEDLPAVLELWARDEAPAVQRLLERTPGSLLVAEDGGHVVGTLIAAWDGWRGNMYRLCVLPEYRRRGVALELVRLGEERLRELGARRITALVNEDDRAAVGLWRSAGYVRDRGVGRFVRDL